MWFFMNTCYFLSLLTFVLFITTGIQGYFRFSVFHSNHATFALLFTIIYLFTQSLIIFFFVGTGVSVRDYTKANHLPAQFHQQSIGIKRRVYPPLLLNMLLVMILFISGGALDTGRVPTWFHSLLFYTAFFHFILVLLREHRAFQENTDIILQMSGVKRK